MTLRPKKKVPNRPIKTEIIFYLKKNIFWVISSFPREIFFQMKNHRTAEPEVKKKTKKKKLRRRVPIFFFRFSFFFLPFFFFPHSKQKQNKKTKRKETNFKTIRVSFIPFHWNVRLRQPMKNRRIRSARWWPRK